MPGTSSCYLTNSKQEYTWQQADAECKSRDSGLVAMETRDEYDAVKDWFQRSEYLGYIKENPGFNAHIHFFYYGKLLLINIVNPFRHCNFCYCFDSQKVTHVCIAELGRN